MQTDTDTCAAKPAHLDNLRADFDTKLRARGEARRQLEADALAKRRTRKRTANAAQASHLIAMPRVAALIKAGKLLGSATALAEVLGIQPRSLRAKTDAERGVSCKELEAVATALEVRAAAMIEHAAKLRAETEQ
ncbi:hypothetical protein [Sphingomonas sp. PP-CC-3A-396]|uniref:hypothetical protein n=1 Tax=Sphingomonas sp. PP-CC-3A-396 TaxID=2135655 RepID=UPI00104C2FD4|nr:hypothetical protein [Sphingomonas sp. PP-CC-3A-396]TCQ04095.1 hypothetical protein C8J40_109230 [Sphingomonas sp. PP-CC-3A-396]